VNKNKAELILQALESKKSTLKPESIIEKTNDGFVKIVRNTRQATRPSIVKIRDQAMANQNAIEDMMAFVKNRGNIYLTFGGVGDLILLLAECHQDPEAKIVYFANSTSKDFGKKFLELFKQDFIILDNLFGSSDAHKAISLLKSTERLQASAHLPDGLDYGDWIRNTQKYASRIITRTNWLDKFGIDADNNGKKHVVFAPSGSYKSSHKQKYLQPHEADAVTKIYLNKGYYVYVVGNHDDKAYYNTIRNPRIFWLTSDEIIDYKNFSSTITFEKFIQILNSASDFCSVDTWLKTYSCLLGKKTIVFENKYNNKYSFGADSGDLIFLNKSIWPSMKLVKIEEFIKNDIYV
jgi:hypothetical protein